MTNMRANGISLDSFLRTSISPVTGIDREQLALLQDSIGLVIEIEEPANLLRQERLQGLIPETKADSTIVTNADLRMNADLMNLLPGIRDVPIISEENLSQLSKLQLGPETEWWLIDPLDGTKTYAEGHPGYCSCVSLMRGTEPILGVIAVPEKQQIYFASKGNGAFRLSLESLELERLDCSKPHDTSILATFYHSTAEGRLELKKHVVAHGLKIEKIIQESAALKYLAVADGTADYAGGWARIKIWDIAAADIIVTEAGGHFGDPVTNARIPCDPKQLDVYRSWAICGSGE